MSNKNRRYGENYRPKTLLEFYDIVFTNANYFKELRKVSESAFFKWNEARKGKRQYVWNESHAPEFLVINHRSRGYQGFVINIKLDGIFSDKGSVILQKNFTAKGYGYKNCYSVEDLLRQIEWYFGVELKR